MKARAELIKECLELVSECRSVQLRESKSVADLVDMGHTDPLEGVHIMRGHEKNVSEYLDKLGKYLCAMEFLED